MQISNGPATARFIVTTGGTGVGNGMNAALAASPFHGPGAIWTPEVVYRSVMIVRRSAGLISPVVLSGNSARRSASGISDPAVAVVPVAVVVVADPVARVAEVTVELTRGLT